MANLSQLEKQQFEDVFGMSSGYVMKDSFNDAKYADLFKSTANIDIWADKYAPSGRSKAKCMRAFWNLEPDPVVGKVVAEFLKVWAYVNAENLQDKAYQAAMVTVARLTGETKKPVQEPTVQEFLAHDFGALSFEKLPVESTVTGILESRYKEAVQGLQNGSSLSTILMCGSILEGALFGVANSNPEKFNRSNCAPKDTSTSKVQKLHTWSLSDLINVAHDVGLLGLDVKKFSQTLRDFRNYIHPYQQMSENFNPTPHTAKICVQVLKAAVAQLSGE